MKTRVTAVKAHPQSFCHWGLEKVFQGSSITRRLLAARLQHVGSEAGIVFLGTQGCSGLGPEKLPEA